MGNCCKRGKGGNAAGTATTGMPASSKKNPKQGKMEDENALVRAVMDQPDFEQKLKDAGEMLLVVDFYATWCGPCKQIAPKLEEMAVEFPDVKFLKVDVDENEELATQYGVSAMPTFLFFKSGSKLLEFSGSNPNKIKETITQLK